MISPKRVLVSLPLGRAAVVGSLAAVGILAGLGFNQPAQAKSSITFKADILACRGFLVVDNGDCNFDPNTPPQDRQARPVILPIGGGLIGGTDATDRQVRFMDLDFSSIVSATGGFSGAEAFQWSPPPGFAIPPEGQARVDYGGGIGSGSCAGSNDPDCTVTWTDVNYDFRPGYVVGSCSLCGPSFRFDRQQFTGGSAIRIGGSASPAGPGLNFNQINGKTLVTLGENNGVKAYLEFQATSNFLSPINSERTNTGYITLTLVEVPAPLPILGAGAAFGFSRKLRTRIKLSSSNTSTV